MRLLIVDDERPAREKLRRLLAQESGITALEEARDGVEALEKIAAFAPDAVFLDIQMPEVSGLEVAASLPQPAPLLVFVTAYDEYAVRAFDANAIDYLLKPYDHARLQRALQRLRERLALRQAASVDAAASAPQASAPPAALLPERVQHLLVSERGLTRIVRVDEIEWLETADNYVILHTADSHPLLRQTLSALLEQLGGAFQRSHRRAAVRLACISSIVANDKGDGDILLRSGARAPLSRAYRAALLAHLA
ncbi:LytTR family DNA-binding domain-containing protein [Massilia sp. BJB1822]|uniref:LytR/AlgR family response regulator transcription factor n=1 Tax=Massilia sp. BJB1822 TaxID=2744470 RepID=UPI001594A936|nr:response regulator [Massilia sp. BJB1822]NVD99384.1 response regulator [Massilia sp. BJB1822]